MKSLANAFGGTTARACDGCVKRRARWYCAADDAFLCQACDGSVHSANSLARRHERVRLKSASFSGKHRPTSSSSASPPRAAAAWHHGFTRKARTPRGGSSKKNHRPVFHDLVPEMSVEDQTENYDEEQLIYRVPVFDPFVAEQCKNDAVETKPEFLLPQQRFKSSNSGDENDNAESCVNEFFPTEIELAEFAADVETLLGHGLETESFSMEELGLADGSSGSGRSSVRLKVEEDEDEDDEEEAVKSEGVNIELCDHDNAMSFGYESRKTCGEEDDKENVNIIVKGENDAKESNGFCVIKEKKRKFLMLSLNYEAVISTWGGQGPPWTAGEPPELDLDDDRWPASMANGEAEGGHHHSQYHGGYCGGGLHAAFGNAGGREARVSRYREKRRTRLFSKKIRYEVRKLNAEKRPRMKGRFVKRASLAAASSTFPMLTTK